MILPYLIYILWILSEIILNRLFRAGKSDQQSRDKKTEFVLWITIAIAVTSAVFATFICALPISRHPQTSLLGLILIFIGIIFRFVAIKQLGRFFTVDVTIRKDHQLMQNGFYKYLRHPSYTGSLLSFLGFGLSLNNWMSLGFAFIPVLLAFIRRMNIEEKERQDQIYALYSYSPYSIVSA
jgi:protein-S-isoprenylcysteine O-methyltransferase Ste14